MPPLYAQEARGTGAAAPNRQTLHLEVWREGSAGGKARAQLELPGHLADHARAAQALLPLMSQPGTSIGACWEGAWKPLVWALGAAARFQAICSDCWSCNNTIRAWRMLTSDAVYSQRCTLESSLSLDHFYPFTCLSLCVLPPCPHFSPLQCLPCAALFTSSSHPLPAPPVPPSGPLVVLERQEGARTFLVSRKQSLVVAARAGRLPTALSQVGASVQFTSTCTQRISHSWCVGWIGWCAQSFMAVRAPVQSR